MAALRWKRRHSAARPHSAKLQGGTLQQGSKANGISPSLYLKVSFAQPLERRYSAAVAEVVLFSHPFSSPRHWADACGGGITDAGFKSSHQPAPACSSCYDLVHILSSLVITILLSPSHGQISVLASPPQKLSRKKIVRVC